MKNSTDVPDELKPVAASDTSSPKPSSRRKTNETGATKSDGQVMMVDVVIFFTSLGVAQLL